MNKTIRLVIPVHSFVDLITNSSSEIFTSATDSTVKAAKEVINGILKAAGSKKSAASLFNVRLNYLCRNDATGYEEMTFETEEARREFLESHDFSESCDEGNVVWQVLVVEAKDSSDADAVAAANKLASFFDTFETWEQYN